jgi:metal-responsive CopG/Arc/MetJ family transcriptional regulator
MAKEVTRVTVNLNSELVYQIDKYAEDMNINRTSAVAVLLTQALSNQKAVNDLSELVAIYKGEQAKKALNDNN